MLMPLHRQQGKVSTTERVFQAFHANFEKSRNVIDFIVGTMISKQRTLLSMDELESLAVQANCGFTRVEAYHLLTHGFGGLELDNHTIKFVPAALPEEYVAYHASLGSFLAKLGERNHAEGVLNREELVRRMEMYASAWKPIRPFRGVVRPTEYVRQSNVLGAVFSSQRNLETVIAVIAAGKNVTLAALQRLFPDDSIMDEEDRHELRQFGILKETGKGWKINEQEWPANIRLLAMHSLGMASALWHHLNPRGSLSRDEHLSGPGPVAHTLAFMPGAKGFELDPYVPREPWEPPMTGVDLPEPLFMELDYVRSSLLRAPPKHNSLPFSTEYAFEVSDVPCITADISTSSDEAFAAMVVAPNAAGDRFAQSTQEIVAAVVADMPDTTFPGSKEWTDGVSTIAFNTPYADIHADSHDVATSSERTIPEMIVAADPVDVPDGSGESIDETLARAFTGDEMSILPDLDEGYFEEEDDGSVRDGQAYDMHLSDPSVAASGYNPRKRPLKKVAYAALKARRNERRVEKLRQTWKRKQAARDEQSASIVISASGVALPTQKRPYRQALNVQESILKNGHDDFYPIQNDREEPTRALPGTEEKVEVLADRLRRGVPLWHPRDAVDYHYGNNEDDRPNILDFLRGRR